MAYTVNTTRLGNFSWQVDSDAVVNGKERKIRAVIDASGIGKYKDVNANGDIQSFQNGDTCTSLGGTSNVNCTRVEENMTLSFSSIFGNIPAVNFGNPNVDQFFDDVKNNGYSDYKDLTNPSGLIYVNITDGRKSNNVNPPALNNATGSSGFLVIEFPVNTKANPNPTADFPSLSLQIADFRGVIWVKGDVNVTVTGNGVYKGALFVEGRGTMNFSGSPGVNYNGDGTPVATQTITSAIAGALAELQGVTPPSSSCDDAHPQYCLCPPNCPNKPTIISWNET
jgi:hypothetical protein